MVNLPGGSPSWHQMLLSWDSQAQIVTPCQDSAHQDGAARTASVMTAIIMMTRCQCGDCFPPAWHATSPGPLKAVGRILSMWFTLNVLALCDSLYCSPGCPLVTCECLLLGKASLRDVLLCVCVGGGGVEFSSCCGPCIASPCTIFAACGVIVLDLRALKR